MKEDLKHFTVVLRGPSAVVFWEDERLAIEGFSSKIGPVNIIYKSRWIKKPDDVTIPGNLWIEVTGHGTSLKDVIVPFANAGISFIPILALSANAAISETEVELGYESTPGISERDYFQNYVPPESGIVHTTRHINAQETIKFISSLKHQPDSERILRAANQYRLSLESWRLGRETISMAHLWMALEALTKAKIRAELNSRGLETEAQLAECLGVDIQKLDPTVRKELILRGDSECYKKAKEASDGFEHGYLGYDKIITLSRDVRNHMAEHIRNAIFELCKLEQETIKILTSDPYHQPKGYWPIVKYLRGKLIGEGEQLAAPGNEYPFMRWNPIIKFCKVDKDQFNFKIDETFTADLAEGISFKDGSLEAWEPH